MNVVELKINNTRLYHLCFNHDNPISKRQKRYNANLYQRRTCRMQGASGDMLLAKATCCAHGAVNDKVLVIFIVCYDLKRQAANQINHEI